MTSGGYRKPEHPAAVSGPGAHSQRTDGQVVSTVPGQGYGDAKQQAMQQQTAPMGAATPLPTPPSVGAGQSDQPPAAPPYQGGALNAPSSNPNQPVTHGVPIGPGGDTSALQMGPYGQSNGIAATSGAMTQLLSQLSATDTTGILSQLYQNASAQGV